MQLIGPFAQLVTMDRLPNAGPLSDDQLEIIQDAGILVQDGMIAKIGSYQDLVPQSDSKVEVEGPAVVIPGLIDSHTHMCYGGSRAGDYALRVSGVSYQEIAKRGGGILDTVTKTREASKESLVSTLLERCQKQLQWGVTTCEVKSGYGLSVKDELKMLEAIQEVSKMQNVDLISTCLAAHTKPKEWNSSKEYLQHIIDELFPVVRERKLSSRMDIFVEEGAFSVEEARHYLQAAKEQGFSVTVHADQFSRGGALLASEVGALSADHLEASTETDCASMKEHGVIPIVLPGASLGLGMEMPPARLLLDSGLPLVIASDWNPGSAPMGNLLLQAAVLGAAQKLTMAETLAALTVRAAAALELSDRGVIAKGKRADLTIYPCGDYREILYQQGSLLPIMP